MVQFQKGKLIIEVSCGGQNPLQLLSDYQKGIVGALHAFGCVDTSALPDNQNSDFNLQTAMYRLTALLHQLMLNDSQSEEVGEAVINNQEALASVNKWGVLG